MMFRSKKLTSAAKDFDCQSCGRYKPSVPAHANWQEYGKGAGLKAHDCFIAFVCPSCHDVIDGRAGRLTQDEQKAKWLAAHIKTLVLVFQHRLAK